LALPSFSRVLWLVGNWEWRHRSPRSDSVHELALPQHRELHSESTMRRSSRGVLAIAVFFRNNWSHAFDSRSKHKLAHLTCRGHVLVSFARPRRNFRQNEPPPGLDPNHSLAVRDAICGHFFFQLRLFVRTSLLCCPFPSEVRPYPSSLIGGSPSKRPRVQEKRDV